MDPVSRLFVVIALKWMTVFFFMSSIACLAVGIALVARQQTVMNWGTRLNRWISTRRLMRPLEKPRDIHRIIYRRHPLVGGIIVIAAAYVIYFLFRGFSPEPFVFLLRRFVPEPAINWLVVSFWWLTLIAQVFAIFIGAIMFARPSALKGIEAIANKTFSAREMGKFWETMNTEPDRIVMNHPKLIGTLIIAGSAYTAVSLGLILVGSFHR